MNNIIAKIIKREGGFVDSPLDRGGATKFGITIKTLSEYRGCLQSRDDVFNLTEEEAYKIYEQNYIIKPKFHLIEDEDLKELVIDSGVHSGVKQAILWLQEASGTKKDGIIGAITLKAANQNSFKVYLKLLAFRIKYLGRLITKDPKQAVFAAGWFNRISEFLGG